MKSKFSREEIIAINSKKTLQQIVIDQSDLFPTHVDETNRITNVSSRPPLRTQTENISNNETEHPVLKRQAVKPSAPKILQIAKNIISELIELNSPGSIQIQNFSSNSTSSSHQKTILYTSRPEKQTINRHDPGSKLNKKSPEPPSDNGSSYIPVDILKRSFGNSKFFTGSPDHT